VSGIGGGVVTELKTRPAEWPRLRVADWADTRDTLHMWTQIVGKIRLAHAPLVNHWWQVTLYVSPRGLTTSAIPYGAGAFDIEFDFLDDRLRVRREDGRVIPGLYAVGEVIGSAAVNGNSFCSGMCLTPAMAFGRIVGRALAGGRLSRRT